MKRWLHVGHFALTVAIAVIVALVAAIAFSVGSHARQQVMTTAMQAAVGVDGASVPACNPPVGGAFAGACAPTQAFAATNAVAKAAGDPEVITGHPLGVDVSSYQGCLTYPKQARFVFIKATEGAGYTNPSLGCQLRQAKSQGLLYGLYDFLRPGSGSASAEAAHFVAVVKAAGANGSLPPVADVEVNAGLSRSQVRAYVATWTAYVRAHLERTVAIVYTGAWFWDAQVAAPVDSLLWVSGYASSVRNPIGWDRYTFWQYSDGVYGPTPHLGGDSSVYAGTLAQLKHLAVTTRTSYQPPKTYHYERLEASGERRTAQLYDRWRAHPAKSARALAKVRPVLRAQARLVSRRANRAVREHKAKRPTWGLFYRGWRFQQLIHRAEGQKVAPTVK